MAQMIWFLEIMEISTSPIREHTTQQIQTRHISLNWHQMGMEDFLLN